MRIRIIIEDDGQGLDIRRSLLAAGLSPPRVPSDMPAGSEGPEKDAQASGCPSSQDELTLGIHAGRLLEALAIDKPGTLLKQFRPERIIEVCEAAERKKDRLKNPAGYVLRALSQGWAV